MTALAPYKYNFKLRRVKYKRTDPWTFFNPKQWQIQRGTRLIRTNAVNTTRGVFLSPFCVRWPIKFAARTRTSVNHGLRGNPEREEFIIHLAPARNRERERARNSAEQFRERDPWTRSEKPVMNETTGEITCWKKGSTFFTIPKGPGAALFNQCNFPLTSRTHARLKANKQRARFILPLNRTFAGVDGAINRLLDTIARQLIN